MPNVSIKKILAALAAVRDSAGRELHLCVVGRGPLRDGLVAALSVAALDLRAGVSSSLDVYELPEFPTATAAVKRWPVCAFVYDEGLEAAAAGAAAVAVREAGNQVVAVLPWAPAPARSALETWAREAGFVRAEIAWEGRPAQRRSAAIATIAAALGDDALAIAPILPIVRKAFVDKLVERTARQNAAIGALFFVPGADMPAMTANQVKMVLAIAAAHGEELGFERALEVLTVIGAAFGLRAAGREATELASPRWVVKGIVGYTGTVALGKAAAAYFEAGAPFTPDQMKRISGTVDRYTKRFIT